MPDIKDKAGDEKEVEETEDVEETDDVEETEDVEETNKIFQLNDNLKLIISCSIGILLILILIFPFIYNRYFCSDSLSSKIVGNASLYITILPASLLAIGLVFVMHPLFIALIYFGYYSLIAWFWCSSRWMFVVLLLMYLLFFFFMMKAKDTLKSLSDFTDSISIPSFNSVKREKKNSNNNK